tara:strand:- start:194 stop:1066 length:873 start_codon:yes stop_codon:yes gene_type:complete
MKIKKNKNCLLCKGELSNRSFPFFTIYNNVSFEYLKCTKCYSTCIYPTPDHETLEKIYSKNNYHNIFYKDYNKKKYLNSVKYINKYIKKNSTFLDYGCGSGYFINALKDYGYKAVGVDYDKKLITDLKKNYEVYTLAEFDDINNKKFDVIHLGDVLEHMIDPINLMNYLILKLNKNGLIYIEGPIERNLSLVNISIQLFGNIRNLFLPFIKRKHTPTHLFFVNLKSQINFFRQFHNLSIIDYKVTETGWPYTGNGFIKNSIAKIAIMMGGKKFFSHILGNRINIILRVND